MTAMSEQSADLPQLVRDDPWLEPQAERIRARIDRFRDTLGRIGDSRGRLAPFARGHQLIGLHPTPEGDWSIREWLPAAKAVSVIGDFNDWSGEGHSLSRHDNGVWSARLPAGSIAHGQRYKLRITGADGSVRDRIPACATRVVQDPETHDFSAQVWRTPEH